MGERLQVSDARCQLTPEIAIASCNAVKSPRLGLTSLLVGQANRWVMNAYCCSASQTQQMITCMQLLPWVKIDMMLTHQTFTCANGSGQLHKLHCL